MRILIIEDLIDISYIMKSELEKYGYSVDVSNNGEEGEEKAYVNSYDVILLDLLLPDKSGIDILRFLRNNKINTPVIVVSARSEESIIIQALNIGADDFIIKPFGYEVLNSKIQAVVRRYYGRVSPNVVIGDMEINQISKKVCINNKNVNLSNREFAILEYIALNYPNSVSSEDIVEHIYDERFNEFSSVIRVHIAKIRRKLKLVSGKSFLYTQKGIGYYVSTEK